MQTPNEEKFYFENEEPKDSNKSSWYWTGFHGKSLWDWLQLIAQGLLPIVLAVIGIRQSQIGEIKKQHEVMSSYLNQIAELRSVRESGVALDREALNLASATTLNTLLQLDGERRGQLLEFLHSANLIGQCQPDEAIKATECEEGILKLNGAKLGDTTFKSKVNLQGINLTEVSLDKANLPTIDLTQATINNGTLRDAILSGAILSDATMKGAILERTNLVSAILPRAKLMNAQLNEADLRMANLSDADLSKASLVGVDLRDADLRGTNLQGADLRDADLTGTPLQAASLKGAIYNDATKFPKWFDPKSRAMKYAQ